MLNIITILTLALVIMADMVRTCNECSNQHAAGVPGRLSNRSVIFLYCAAPLYHIIEFAHLTHIV